MVRLKLQLFALNTNTSIVDYLKSQGQDSSYTARKKMAQDLGISNYSGTAEQNTQMLNTLKNKSASANARTTNTVAPSASNTPKAKAISGADQHLVDKATSQYVQSGNVTNAKNEAEADRNAYKELAGTSFNSEAYNQAMAYTNQLLEQLSSGRTSYTDQIKDLMGQIQNREDFSYDASEDTMFQQMLSSAMASGQSAMMDTMGQASALTGGYASTYAQSAGNQAYNSYIQEAYANLPQYYNMALEAYQMEGQDMYNQLSMLSDADASEYQRMYDSWNANFANAQQIYQNEYGAYQDSINNAYNMYQVSQNHADTLYAQEYQKLQNEVSNALGMIDRQYADFRDTQNFAEQQRQYNESMAWEKESFAQKMAEDKRQYDTSLAQSNAQFIARYDINGDGVVDSKDQMVEEKDDKLSLKDATEKQYDNALKAYNTAIASGSDEDWKAYEEYMARLEKMGVNIEDIETHISTHGAVETKGISWMNKLFGTR
jgi:hypothetical protein